MIYSLISPEVKRVSMEKGNYILLMETLIDHSADFMSKVENHKPKGT